MDAINGDAMEAEMGRFNKRLKLNSSFFSHDARYEIMMAREERLRLPDRIPPDEIMGSLRNYTVNRIIELCELAELGKTQFVELRNLVCSRLTIFNARRGGEPARMRLGHWNDQTKWITNSTKDLYFQGMTITYCPDMPGKGQKLVDTIFPPKCVQALGILTD